MLFTSLLIWSKYFSILFHGNIRGYIWFRGNIEEWALLLFSVREFTEYGVSGVISTPGYPKNYPNGLDYNWKFFVPDGYVIELKFEEVYLQDDSGCNKDYIRIHDGENVNGKILGKYCGRILVEPVRTSGNKLLLHFHSDESVERKGFKISWKAIEQVQTTQTTMSSKMLTTC